MLSQSLLNDHELCQSIHSFPQPPHGLNKTKTVRVPSSEHVAEIVGRQGCKIKALRAKTNTYIKTPVRGSDPTFLITGRNEDVESAANEIESAAAHFSNIRANKRINGEGQVVGYVKVPYKVVGLIVGQRGTTIKKIQEETGTYIVTPSRDKDPIFEITGLIEDVTSAFEEIKTHVRIRTGNLDEDISDIITINICDVESSDQDDTKTQMNEEKMMASDFFDLPSRSSYDPLNMCRLSYEGALPGFPEDLCNRFTNSLSFSGYNSIDRRLIRPFGNYNRIPIGWNNLSPRQNSFPTELYSPSVPEGCPRMYMNHYFTSEYGQSLYYPNSLAWKSHEED